jgi:heme-degrading monooxygenase HmoA
MRPASTPDPPYYAVIFTSSRTDADEKGYLETAVRMLELAAAQPGYLGVELAPGITISYWRDEESIAAWKRDAEHAAARAGGRARWYEQFEVRVARVERAYGFERTV